MTKWWLYKVESKCIIMYIIVKLKNKERNSTTPILIDYVNSNEKLRNNNIILPKSIYIDVYKFHLAIISWNYVRKQNTNYSLIKGLENEAEETPSGAGRGILGTMITLGISKSPKVVKRIPKAKISRIRRLMRRVKNRV